MIITACGRCSRQALIPLITAHRRRPIRRARHVRIWPLAGLALLFGVAERRALFVRATAMARAALGLESDVRHDLFSHLQRLPVAFHDDGLRPAAVRCATTDLSTIGDSSFGFVFLIANTARPWSSWVAAAHHLVLGFRCRGHRTARRVHRRFELRYSRDARRAPGSHRRPRDFGRGVALGIRVISPTAAPADAGVGYSPTRACWRDASSPRQHAGQVWAALEGQPQLVLAGVTCGGVLARLTAR